MCYVHGHARDLGWVVSHVRRPNRPGAGQLPLVVPPVTGDGHPEPRVGVAVPWFSPDGRRGDRNGAPADQG